MIIMLDISWTEKGILQRHMYSNLSFLITNRNLIILFNCVRVSVRKISFVFFCDVSTREGYTALNEKDG